MRQTLETPMPTRLQGGEPADKPGPQDASVIEGVGLIRLFMRRRDVALDRLYGSTVSRSPLQNEITREVFYAWAESRETLTADYARLMADYGSPPSVAKALRVMADADLVILALQPDDRRSKRVYATKRLVNFYREEMPALRQTAIDYLQRGALPPTFTAPAAARPDQRSPGQS